MKEISILFVDDEDDLLELYKFFLDELPVHYELVNSVDKAIKLLEEHSFDIVMSDIRMPLKSGIDFLEEVRRRNFPIRHFCFVSAYKEISKEAIIEKGADNIIYKPVSREILTNYLHDLIRKINAEKI